MNQNSRYITHPSTVEKLNTTVLVIDPTQDDLDQLTDHLQNTDNSYDVYLYEGKIGDLEWLNHININCDQILIDNDSQVSISSNSTRYTASTLLDHFGKIADWQLSNFSIIYVYYGK